MEFARSKSGHDKNQIYLIKEKDEKFVYLVNGTPRTLDMPKKKNAKHIQIIKNLPQLRLLLTLNKSSCFMIPVCPHSFGSTV